MQRDIYYQPDTCHPGKLYYIKDHRSGPLTKYRSVRFVDYCPHPAEVIIRDGNKTKVIHRVYLLAKNGRK